MQIDLKHAHIFIRDAYVGPGTTQFLVNNVSGYSSGAVTMLIDGGIGIIATGDSFTVAGDNGVTHSVTSHIETTGNTTSVTFTPALGAMVADNAALTILPHQLEMKIGEGNCSYSEKRTIEYKKDRGLLDKVREGDQDPVEVKIDAMWEFLRSMPMAAVPTPEEALKQIGPAANWISTSPDLCEPYAVDIQILYTPPCTGEYKELITLPMYRWETLEHDPKAGMIQTSGKCNVVQATVVRQA